MPKVSIITPVYNGEKYLKQSLESIQSQSYKDFEHIIVDDGSSDNSAAIIREISPHATYIYQKNKGQAAAVNTGLRATRGEYVGFCDQDDWWLPEKLKRQVAFLDAHPDIDLVYCDAFLGDGKGTVMETTWMQSRQVSFCAGSYQQCAARLFKRNFIAAPLVVLMRRSIFDRQGLLNERFSSAYDYDYWFRMLEAGMAFGALREPLAVWRTHLGQESRNLKKAKRMQWGILTQFLARNPRFIFAHPLLVAYKLALTGAWIVVLSVARSI